MKLNYSNQSSSTSNARTNFNQCAEFTSNLTVGTQTVNSITQPLTPCNRMYKKVEKK